MRTSRSLPPRQSHAAPSAAPYRVQCGDPICIVGLFHWHSGSGRNTPIVHSGNIALLPDPREKIPIKDRVAGQLQKVEAYLVEVQTFEGLSGAPVFQREMVAMRDTRTSAARVNSHTGS